MEEVLHTPVPVSYTHLDVYKRQAQTGDFYGMFKEMDGLPVIVRLLDPPLHEFLESPRAVSYTHLDVYKRQPYDSIEIHSSPRRLIVMAYGVADATEVLVEEYKGPAAKICLLYTSINSAMREVRMAMLEADVNFKVVKQFVARTKERCLDAEVLLSLIHI